MKVNKDFRISLSEKLMDLGNLALAGITFVAFISKEKNLLIYITGLILWSLSYFLSYIIGGKIE